ncbi:MAG: glyoxalase [Bradyrhizobium sp.]|nr:glyoxalase [Pseudomonadota bacterium]MDE2068943.1 glyoxalase [Bradyrhizobium sp.]
MVSADPEALAEFYLAAFGFLGCGSGPSSVMGGGIELRLGRQMIKLIRAGPGGRFYPADVAGWSPLFQHIAIVVADMARAYAHLCTIPAWQPISTSGPQLLPAASGGVSAFKFRDPEGHPLELIAFPPNAVPEPWRASAQGIYLGIDHSAISVSNTAISVDFYESLGLGRSGGSFNVGREQALLDGVSDPMVEVTSLTPAQTTPHVELLCYRGDFDRRVRAQDPDDVIASRLVLAVENRAILEALCTDHSAALLSGPASRAKDLHCALMRDPDGHLIWLEASA